MELKLTPPLEEKKVLLHSCCAPCAGSIIEDMLGSGIEVTLFYYNPNIHPREEYILRKQENIRFTEKIKIPFVEGNYDSATWFKRVKGLEKEHERGKRCEVCFDLRLEQTAKYAYKNGFKVFTSSLGISRWKNPNQINACGIRAANRYPGLIFWTHNWRKKGGSQRMHEIAKKEHFYRQQYCGCVYSFRE